MEILLRRENGRLFDARVPPRNQDVLITSVPHTGTVFLRDVLYCNYFHCDDLTPAQFDNHFQDKVIVSPLRDPRAVYCSWIKRENTLLGINRNRFIKNWKRLREIDEKYDVHYIPVDRPERVSQLQALEDKLDRELKTDWEPKNSVPGDVSEIENIKWIYDLRPVKEYYCY